jgi:isopentenyl-diphosphate delta-isomerase
MTTSSRKMDHIRICLEKNVGSGQNPFVDLVLIHRAMPEISESEIDMSCNFLGKRLEAPIMIGAMTGGHRETMGINMNLAMAAQELGVALGVGSQRAALEDEALADTFSIARDAAPDVPLIGNIGAAQLRKSGPEVIERIAEMIDADAIAVHLNFLQESIQPEGDRDASGVVEAIKSAASGHIPIIVKETGAGISGDAASKLVEAGVKTIDVSGVGGTSWSGVEAYRAQAAGDLESEQMGRLFWSWGIPTPVAIVECKNAGAEVISSGGVRSGLDVAKSMALGASLAGIALPMLEPATKGSEKVIAAMSSYLRALRISMFLTGCKNLSELQETPLMIFGRTREWLELRGFDTKNFSYRELAK